MTIDMLIDGILDSYHRYGLINRSDSDSFPNRQNVVEILGDIQTLVFPGFKKAEDIDPVNIRYVTGQKVNNVIAKLTKEMCIKTPFCTFGSLKPAIFCRFLCVFRRKFITLRGVINIIR